MKFKYFLSFWVCAMMGVTSCVAAYTDPDWERYIDVDIPEYSMFFSRSDKDKEPYWGLRTKAFSSKLKRWKLSKADDIDHYQNMGFPEKLAKLVVNERIAWAEQVVQDNFDDIKVPDVVGFAENRASIMQRTIDLGHDRFKKMVDKYHFGVTDNFYQCVCQSSGHAPAGGGHNYKDGGCFVGGPLGGGHYEDLTNDPKVWSACSAKHRTTDGQHIFQLISKNMISDAEKVASLKERADVLSNRNEVFKKNCLPALSGKIEKRILDPNNFVQASRIEEALKLSENSSNICEEAVATNLYFLGNQATPSIAVAAEVAAIWFLPSELFPAEILNEQITKELAIIGFSSSLSEAVPVMSNAYNVLQIVDRLGIELEARQLAVPYQQAFDLFQDSKNWTNQEIVDYETNLKQELNSYPAKIKQINEDHIAELKTEYAAAIEREIQQKERVKTDGEKLKKNLNIDAANIAAINNRADIRKFELLLERSRTLLKKKVISDYRRPFNEKGYEKYLSDRNKACKEKLAREAQEKRLALEEAQRKARESALKQADQIPMGGQASPSGGIGGPIVSPLK